MSYLQDFKNGVFYITNTDVDRIKVILLKAGAKKAKGKHSFYFCRNNKLCAGNTAPKNLPQVNLIDLYHECVMKASPKTKQEDNSLYTHVFPIKMNLAEAHEFIKKFDEIDKARANVFAHNHALILLKGELEITKQEYESLKWIDDKTLQNFFDATFSKYFVLKKGTPCLVQVNKKSQAVLRYADGKGEFFVDGKLSGNTANSWHIILPLTAENLNKLPVVE